MKADVPVIILFPGMNKEYTASGKRFFTESGISPKISIEEGIRIQIDWQTKGILRI